MRSSIWALGVEA